MDAEGESMESTDLVNNLSDPGVDNHVTVYDDRVLKQSIHRLGKANKTTAALAKRFDRVVAHSSSTFVAAERFV